MSRFFHENPHIQLKNYLVLLFDKKTIQQGSLEPIKSLLLNIITLMESARALSLDEYRHIEKTHDTTRVTHIGWKRDYPGILQPILSSPEVIEAMRECDVNHWDCLLNQIQALEDHYFNIEWFQLTQARALKISNAEAMIEFYQRQKKHMADFCLLSLAAPAFIHYFTPPSSYSEITPVKQVFYFAGLVFAILTCRAYLNIRYYTQQKNENFIEVPTSIEKISSQREALRCLQKVLKETREERAKMEVQEKAFN